MKKLSLKKLTSVVLAAAMLVTSAFCGAISTAAADGTKITYKYIVTSDEAAAFEGLVLYPSSALNVNSVTVFGATGTHLDAKGTIRFNSTASDNSDFSGGKAIITVEFTVKGAYNERDIVTKLMEFYNVDQAKSGGNISYKYANVIDGKVITSGTADIDHPENNKVDPTVETTEPETTEPETTQPGSTDPTQPAEISYQVIYSYYDADDATEYTTRTKTVKAMSDADAKSVAAKAIPNIKNPYFTNYTIDTAEKTGSTIRVTLKGEKRLYTVSVDGKKLGSYGYKEIATVTADSEKAFLIDGETVATGKSFSFYVTGGVDIITETAVSEIEDAVTISDNGLYASDKSADKTEIRMELLATARVANFQRMGVVFSRSTLKKADILSAVKEVATGTKKASNGIAVHNSSVDSPNVSGQYQFIYVPVVSSKSVDESTVIYFYSFAVNKNGDIIVSSPKKLSVADALS